MPLNVGYEIGFKTIFNISWKFWFFKTLSKIILEFWNFQPPEQNLLEVLNFVYFQNFIKIILKFWPVSRESKNIIKILLKIWNLSGKSKKMSKTFKKWNSKLLTESFEILKSNISWSFRPKEFCNLQILKSFWFSKECACKTQKYVTVSRFQWK